MNELELEYFLFKLPIYSPIKITSENTDDFLRILKLGRTIGNSTIEGYNPFRGVDSTFSGYGSVGQIDSFKEYGGCDNVKIQCRRYRDILDFFIHYDPVSSNFMKVGQYPSVADFHTFELKKYRKVLHAEKLREFSRGIGLAANGVGIGSFVYLRRIFEYLIFSTYDSNKSSIKIQDVDFKTMRMEDKIQSIKSYLPDFLVKNKSLYSILSNGIHALEEKECLAYFDTVRVGIEIILDQKLEELKKVEKENIAQKKIDELQGQLKK